MDRNQERAGTDDSREKAKSKPDRENDEKLGREQPGKGLDTGVETGAIQPGQTGDARPLN